MLKYDRSNFDGDYAFLVGKVSYQFSDVDGAIEKFQKCIELYDEWLERTFQKQVETGELVQVEPNPIPMHLEIKPATPPDKLWKDFSGAMTDLQRAAFYNSLMILSYSAIEYGFLELCRMVEPYIPEVKEEDGKKIDTLQMKIEKSVKFLDRAFTLDIMSMRGWSTVKDGQRIRNLLVHNAGNIMKDYTKPMEQQENIKLFKALSQSRKLHMSETGFMYIRDIEFIKKFKDESLMLFRTLVLDIQNRQKNSLLPFKGFMK